MRKYESVVKTESMYDHFANHFAEMPKGDPDNFRGAVWDAVIYIAETEGGNKETALKHFRDLLKTLKSYEVTEGDVYRYLITEMQAPRI